MLRPLFGMLVLILILTACGKDAPPAATNTPLPTTVPTTLAVWYSDPTFTDGLNDLVAAFSRTYPAVNIELTLQEAQTFPEVVTTALEGGQGPDLIIAPAPAAGQWMEQRLLTPLESPTMRQLLSFTTPNGFMSGMQNDVMVAYPLTLEFPILYSNTALVEGEITTFEAFATAAAEHGAVIQPDFMMTHGWLQMENMSLPLRPQGELTVTAQGFTDYLNRLLRLRDSGKVRFGTDSAPFTAGEVGLYIGSSRELPGLKAVLGDQLTIQKPQLAPELASYQFATPTLMMISLNATDANVEAGKLFIEFVAQPAQQDLFSQRTGLFPMRYSLTPDPLLEQLIGLAQDALVVPAEAQLFYDTLLPRYNNAIAQVLAGVLTPEEAAQTLFQGE